MAAASGLERRLRSGPIGIGVSAVLVLLAVVLALQGNDGEQAQAVGTPPELVDGGELGSLEESLGHEVYWAGELPPDRSEVREEADGSVYLRYLPPGVDAGDPRERFLTVGTYPVADATAALRDAAAEAKVALRRIGAATVFVDPASAGSVYLAYAGSDLQIEVYDPAPGRALELVRSGAIRPVG